MDESVLLEKAQSLIQDFLDFRLSLGINCCEDMTQSNWQHYLSHPEKLDEIEARMKEWLEDCAPF